MISPSPPLSTRDALAHLPAAVHAHLDALCKRLLGSGAADGCWIVLHGSAAHPMNWHAPSSDVNVTCVLAHPPEAAQVQALHDAIGSLWTSWPMTLAITSQEELASSTDVFPLKYAEMQRHHVMLHGPDQALSSLDIAWDHLRLRLEQQLKLLVEELRQLLPQARNHPTLLLACLDQWLSTFMSCLSATLFLRDADWWVSEHDALIEASAQTLELSEDVLLELLHIRQRERHPTAGQLHLTMTRWHDMATTLAHRVDHLDQGDVIS